MKHISLDGSPDFYGLRQMVGGMLHFQSGLTNCSLCGSANIITFNVHFPSRVMGTWIVALTSIEHEYDHHV